MMEKLLLMSFLSVAMCHLCLIEPRQRGEMDISKAGSGTCFRHGSPCGGQNASIGSYNLVFGGSQTFLKWQQNFNHYTVGFPGYMDIAIAEYGSDSWLLLAFVQDEYVYAQEHQQNYTAIVVIPNKACDHCVIRARYNSHKPGEETFYQCSDVAVQQTEPSHAHNHITVRIPENPEHQNIVKNIQKLQTKFNVKTVPVRDHKGMSLRGFAYSPFDPDTVYFVNATLDGQVITFGHFNMGIDNYVRTNFRGRQSKQEYEDSTLLPPRPFLLDSVLTVDGFNGMVGLLHEGTIDDPTATFVQFDTHQGTILYKSTIAEFDGHPYSGIIYNDGDGHFYTFSLQANGSKGFDFVVGQLHIEKEMLPYIYQEVVRTEPEPLYVNYQWMTIDPKGQRLFVLMGNENAPNKLNARIYIFDLNNKKLVKITEVDVSQFTFMSIHYYIALGKLYAMSPGLWNGNLWSLVEIDPLTGKVFSRVNVADMEYFKPYYGGSVFNAINQDTGQFYHVLSLQGTNANVIAVVGIHDYNVMFSNITNLSHVHNLALTLNSL